MQNLIVAVSVSATSTGGDHTRSVRIAAPKKGGIMKFAKIREKCLNCKAPLKGKGEAKLSLVAMNQVPDSIAEAVCELAECQARIPDVYLRHLKENRRQEALYSKLWSQCQRCTSSMFQDVLCSK